MLVFLHEGVNQMSDPPPSPWCHLDYTAQTGYNLVFKNSTRTILVTVVTLNNGVVEGLQAFQVALRSVDQAVIFDQPTAEVVIADVDSESSSPLLHLVQSVLESPLTVTLHL